MKTKRGQLAFEFLLIYSFFILVFMASIYVISQRSNQQQSIAEGIFVREIAMRFADELNTASAIPGYEKNYSFPRTLRGLPYNVSISNGLLDIDFASTRPYSFVYPLATSNVFIGLLDTSVVAGQINTSIGWAVLRNVNGSVVISQ